MKNMKEFTIPFVGLKLGEHQFDFKIRKTFFENYKYDEFNEVNIKLDVLLIKKPTLLEFNLAFNGKVNVYCDLTNEPYNQKLSGKYNFIVKFGVEFNNENEELLILPHGSYEINIQHYIYESIILAMPTRMIHPGIKDGTLKSDILNKLEELRPKLIDDEIKSKGNNTDPRWDTLKKLLTDK